VNVTSYGRRRCRAVITECEQRDAPYILTGAGGYVPLHYVVRPLGRQSHEDCREKAMMSLTPGIHLWKSLLCCILVWQPYSGICQATKDGWQVATILAINEDQNAAHHNPPITRYDISLKVNHTVYVIRYTPPPGTYGMQFATGYQKLVHVGDQTITFNDQLGRARQAPIVSRKPGG
jgi:hypothetical protein